MAARAAYHSAVATQCTSSRLKIRNKISSCHGNKYPGKLILVLVCVQRHFLIPILKSRLGMFVETSVIRTNASDSHFFVVSHLTDLTNSWEHLIWWKQLGWITADVASPPLSCPLPLQYVCGQCSPSCVYVMLTFGVQRSIIVSGWL